MINRNQIIFYNFAVLAMIKFESENIDLPFLDFDKLRTWIITVANSHGFDVGRVSYRFVNDDTILETNRQFLGHDYYTDIITFDCTRYYPSCQSEETLSSNNCEGSQPSAGRRGKVGGDIVISLDTVRSNAQEIGESYDRELLRVIIHGVLHLCGINDKGPGEREVMEKHENEALELWLKQ